MTTLAALDLPANNAATAWLHRRTEAALSQVREVVTEIKTAPPARASVLIDRWNAVDRQMANIASIASTFAELHPVPAAREQAEHTLQQVDRLRTELDLDHALFTVFAQAEVAGLDESAARLHAKALQDFRRAGVDQDGYRRDRLAEIAERMVVLGQEFSKNIREDARTIRVRPDQLAGMPQDWIDARPAGQDGLVEVSTDYPDFVPFSTFCRDAAARRELRIEFLNQAWPANDAILQELFALRREYAHLVGYANWADYTAEVRMIGSGPAIGEFIETVTTAAAESARRDRDVVLARLQQDRPQDITIDAADVSYYTELVRSEQFDVDAQQVRTFFDFGRVCAGLLAVTGRLFDLEYRPAPRATVWHEDVLVYDVHLLDGERIGRVYLDLHPREGKFKHAAQFDLVPGIDGQQLAEGVLACNLPRGLMEHDDVVTLFHEFGHLLHHVLAGRGRWVRFSGVATEWDFVEAPSQLLEEWAWDAGVLSTFARDAGGRPIPADLVHRMRKADDFGKGFDARTQMFYAAVSYSLHTEQVADLTEATAQLQERYSMFPYIPGTHMAASFGHLEGYSSEYYTYMWSLVIAKDMFSAFDPGDLFAPQVARRYREAVLEPGGSKDAADLVAAFLGRPYSFEAFSTWLAS